jgi:hypothetical protein
VPTPSRLAELHLDEINDSVRPTAEAMLRELIPPASFDHFPVDADDLLQVAWLRVLIREEQLGLDLDLDGMCRYLKAYVRNIAREFRKQRRRRNRCGDVLREMQRAALSMRRRRDPRSGGHELEATP